MEQCRGSREVQCHEPCEGRGAAGGKESKEEDSGIRGSGKREENRKV
jgi:hypothetical protein